MMEEGENVNLTTFGKEKKIKLKKRERFLFIKA